MKADGGGEAMQPLHWTTDIGPVGGKWFHDNTITAAIAKSGVPQDLAAA